MNGCHPFTKKSQLKLVICWGMPTLFGEIPTRSCPNLLGFRDLILWDLSTARHQLQYHSGGEKKTQTNFPGGHNTLFKHLFIMIPVHCGPNLKVRWAILSHTWPTYSNHIRTKCCMSRISKEPSKNEQYQLQLLPENLWETGVQDKKHVPLQQWFACLPGQKWVYHDFSTKMLG